MSDDLVKRLHLPWPKDESVEEVTLPVWVLALTSEAADRIEELKKERDTYFAERNKFQLYLQRTHADWELEVAAVDGLNAKLAKAVEALGDMEKVPCSEASTGILKVMIRYTIAELKG